MIENHPETQPLLPLRILIVDDEVLAREKVRIMLRSETDIGEVHECRSAREALKLIPATKPDIIFLDVQMPGLNGFDLLHALDAIETEEGYTPLVIFVTAYQEYAVQAFTVNAVDYLLKPFDKKRFQAALQRARQSIEAREAKKQNAQFAIMLNELQTASPLATETAAPQYLEHFVARVRGKITLVRTDRACWMESEGNYINVHTTEGASYLVRETISGVEAKLNPHDFMRIHRTVIVAKRFVKNFTTSTTNDYDSIILHDGTELPLSRSYRENVLNLLR
jgi:two-component system LytT family response regulator